MPSLAIVTSTLIASNSASNAASHSSFRPKRRHHHAPACAKIHPQIEKSSTSYSSPSLSLFQARPTSQRNDVSTNDCGENAAMICSKLKSTTSLYGLALSPTSFVAFTSSFVTENVAIARSEDNSNFVSSFIPLNSSRFETEELQLPAPLSQEHNDFAPSHLAAWLTFIGLLTRMILLHRPFDRGNHSSSVFSFES